ncbi:MAG: Biopolymer transport protein ExbD/TolR [Holophagaceae bacterium]|nr:Biopolymer transport protein ExbD/TolR [Holophagaceae bacterium]
MGMDVGGGKGGAKADINVTPLVDIVLVLLIIFIVITPAVNDAVKLPMAKYSVKPETDKNAKYLTLMLPAKRDPKDFSKVVGPGFVMLDDKDAKEAHNTSGWDMTSTEGRKALVGFIKRSTDYLVDKRVFVKAEADLPFKYVNELFQICREGGADEASIVTAEDKSEKEKK